jgi:hypothetical protein
MGDARTQGIEGEGGFQSVNSGGAGVNYKTTSGEGLNTPGADQYGVRYLPSILGYLEDHSLFTGTILAFVGYVLIASFGQMKSIGQYLGYVCFASFLALLLFFNRKRLNIEKINWPVMVLLILVFGFEVYLVFVVFKNDFIDFKSYIRGLLLSK